MGILLAAKNQTGGAFAQVRGEIKSLDDAAGALAGGLGTLAKGAGIAGLALLGQQAATAAVDLSEMGMKATMLRESLDDLARQSGTTGSAILNSLRTASRGAISDSELILAANKAMLLGVAKNADDMSKLMEIAATRGRAMGETTAAAFNDIVTGLGRGSALILDNLGIVVNATEINEKYAKSLGKTAEQLTETEKKQALIAAVLSDTSVAAEAAVNPHERLDAATRNLTEAIGEFINTSTPIPGVIGLTADAAQRAADEIHGMAERSTGAAQEIAVLEQAVIGLTNDLGQQAQGLRRMAAAGQESSAAYHELEQAHAATKTQLAQVNAELELARRSLLSEDAAARAAAGGTDVLRGEFIQLTGAAQAAGNEVEIVTGKVEDLMRALGNEALQRSQQDWQRMSGAIDSAAAASGRLFAENQGGDAGLARQKDLSAELNAQVGYWRIQGHTMQEINEVLLPAYVANIADADRALFDTTAQTRELKDAAKEAEQMFNDLKGTVRGVLESALDPGVGVDPDEVLKSMGLSGDAINENARRLADIAKNGLKGQDWLSEFRAEAPNVWKAIASASNPQEEAARMLKDFQMGLRPDLLDKGMAKDLVRAMILGDQKMDELAQEIAAELAAEMGVSMQQAMGATQSVLGGGGASGLAGQDAAGAFTDGALVAMGDKNTGGAMVETVKAQIAANQALLRTAGQDAGRVFGDGFLTGTATLAADFIAQVAAAVVGPVQSALNTQASLQGAATP